MLPLQIRGVAVLVLGAISLGYCWYLSLYLRRITLLSKHALCTVHNALLAYHNFHIPALVLVLVTIRKRSAQTQILAKFTQLLGKRNPGVP